jgi:uncharacterized protein (TIGR02246 family)
MHSPHDPADEGVRARVKEFVAAYNRGDATGAEDGTHTHALGFTHRGRAEIEAGLRGLFAGPFKGTHIQITPERIRLISDGVAIEEATFVLTGLRTPAGVAMDAIQGLCLGVYQMLGSQWFAAAVQCFAPPPAAGKCAGKVAAQPAHEADRAHGRLACLARRYPDGLAGQVTRAHGSLCASPLGGLNPGR